MKTEHEIAIENVTNWQLKPDMVYVAFCQEHEETCQRFLEFLEEWKIFLIRIEGFDTKAGERLQKRITDLNNAINEYEEAGI